MRHPDRYGGARLTGELSLTACGRRASKVHHSVSDAIKLPTIDSTRSTRCALGVIMSDIPSLARYRSKNGRLRRVLMRKLIQQYERTTEIPDISHSYRRKAFGSVFSARCKIYISRLCYDVSVRPSVCLSVCLFRECIVVTVNAGKRGGVISRYASHC